MLTLHKSFFFFDPSKRLNHHVEDQNQSNDHLKLPDTRVDQVIEMKRIDNGVHKEDT